MNDCKHKWIALSNDIIERYLFDRFWLDLKVRAWGVNGCTHCGAILVDTRDGVEPKIVDKEIALAGKYWHDIW